MLGLEHYNQYKQRIIGVYENFTVWVLRGIGYTSGIIRQFRFLFNPNEAMGEVIQPTLFSEGYLSMKKHFFYDKLLGPLKIIIKALNLPSGLLTK